MTVVIPAFNEEDGIEESVGSVLRVMEDSGIDFELIVVDDGSSDRTGQRSEAAGARVLSLPENRGYGAALKAGIGRAKYEIIVITDADGTYPAESIPVLLHDLGEYDMVVGARVGESVAIPLIRRPAKWFLRRLAGYLAGRHIPDLNSGLRVIRKSLVKRFEHLLPSGFSFTTTLTLASLCSGSLVRYSPIDYHKRI